MKKSKRNTKTKLSHIDSKGKATMVDVTSKTASRREAVARGSVYMRRQTIDLITDNKISKGDVFGTARIAGIMAAKKACDLIPLCHPLNITSVTLNINPEKKKNKVDIEAKVICTGQTGVEMEAITAVSVAAITIYDMCKAVDRAMVISDIILMEKKGGKSGAWKR